MYPPELDAMPIVLPGEGRLLELISTDLPLKDVLNDICAALDVQVGSAVSVVLSTEDDEHVRHQLAEKAVQFGLYVFSCCAILSDSDQLLGTLETYSCLSRRPAVSQTRLIQRASQLAALAIQRHDREHDPWGLSLAWITERSAPEGHLPEN
jgi:hypothetical protein